MTLTQEEHAERVANRFKQLVENAGDFLQEEHYQELALLIEAALDAAAIEQMESITRKLEAFTVSLRQNKNFLFEGNV
ncbi:MAG: hypothetical protein H6510_04535 [Acidobacteria bacterium]|nr:hypothetical protein [Acidobacteriota bacterium]MCB9397063.1 hypothetical protein [Acidobacteriota bacterium]